MLKQMWQYQIIQLGDNGIIPNGSRTCHVSTARLRVHTQQHHATYTGQNWPHWDHMVSSRHCSLINVFTSHSTQNRSFWRCSFQPISGRSVEDTTNLTQQIQTIQEQDSLSKARTKNTQNAKSKQTQKINLNLNSHSSKNCWYTCAYHCAQLSYTTQHRTVLMIFPLILQTIIIHSWHVVNWRGGGQCSTQPNYREHGVRLAAGYH